MTGPASGGGTTITRFIYDGDALVAEYDGTGTMTARYIHGSDAAADDPLAWDGGGTRRFLIRDHEGSVIAVADASGGAPTINTYDEYGVPGAGNTGRFQYTGQAWLPELGLYYYKARIYSPTLGRFMQTDPIGYADQMNLYEYVGDDPMNHTDPSGMTIICNERECIIRPNHFDRSRSNGQTTTLNDAQAHQAVADRRHFRTNGQNETLGFGFGTRSGETRTQVSTNATTGRGGLQYDPRTRQTVTTAEVGRAPLPQGATWAQHGHIEGSGMVDNIRVRPGYGDSQTLTQNLANVVVSDDTVGVREIVDGELQHRMLLGRPGTDEAHGIESNLDAEQPLFYRPR